MKAVAVVGMGYVGIPVAACFAKSGLNVFGIDIDKNKVQKINQGIYPIDGEEPGIEELIKEVVSNNKLVATTEYSDAENVEAWIVCVQTPFNVDDFKPNQRALRGAITSIAKSMKKGCLVVVESTIPPGTIDEVVKPILEEESGMVAGIEFSLGHCPERVKPGLLLHNLTTYGRALGGIDSKTHDLMLALYSNITSGELSPVNIKTAEVVKTFENTYRDAEIAIANDFAKYCDAVGVDFFKVRDLVNVVESRNLHLPGGGVGGHCIPKDTWLLAYGSREKYIPEYLIKARHINDSMPSYVAELTLEGLSYLNVNLNNAKIAILGLSYLEESDDTRNSPTISLIESLKNTGAEIVVHDHYVQEDNTINHSNDLDETVLNSDVVIVMVSHRLYSGITADFLKEKMNNLLIIDARNVFQIDEFVSKGFEFCGIGRGSTFDKN